MTLIDKRNKFQLFWLVLINVIIYINMKNYENIECADFVNVNIALNLHFYEEN